MKPALAQSGIQGRPRVTAAAGKRRPNHLLFFRMATVGIIALLCRTDLCAAETAGETVLHSAGFTGGTVIVVGGDTSLVSEIVEAGKGKALVEGLTTDPAAAAEGRTRLAAAGVFPLADVRHVKTVAQLPYVDALASLVVVDRDRLGAAGPADEEVLRVLGWKRAAMVRSGGKWTRLDKKLTDDVGEWTHGLHGPDRYPVSKEDRIGPWMDSVRWIIGFNAVHSAQSLSMRLAGGRLFTFVFETKSAKFIECRDAYSGVRLWRQRVDFVAEGPYFTTSGQFTADDRHVFIYPKIGGHLTAFDAATGEVAKVYDKTATIAPGDTLWGRHGGGQKVPVAEPGALAAAGVLLVGDDIIQSFMDNLWCVDRATGTIRWHFQTGNGGYILTPCVAADGSIYAHVAEADRRFVPNKLVELIALDGRTGKPIWRTPIDKGLMGRGITAPRNGVIPFQVEWDNPEKPGSLAYGLRAYDQATGKLLWTKTEKAHGAGGYRSYTFSYRDQVIEAPAYKQLELRDPKTGERTADLRYPTDAGGCSFNVFSAKYTISGCQLTPVDKWTSAYISNAQRTSCEEPTLPAYGAIYLTTPRCGCDMYLPCGASSIVTGRKLAPWAAAERLVKGGGATVSGAVQAPQPGPIVSDWRNTVDHRGKGKPMSGWKFVDDNVKKELDERIGRVGSPQAKINWYGDPQTEAVQVGDLHLVAVKDQHVLEARRGPAPQPVTGKQGKAAAPAPKGEVVWSFLAGGRIGSAPVIAGKTAIFGCNDGWVYAVNVADGSLAWRALGAPQEQRMGAFSQIESAWPVFGVVLHEGQLLGVAGRLSSLDRGLFAFSLDPATGAERWRQRMATDPIYWEWDAPADPSQPAKAKPLPQDLWPQPWMRIGQSVNMPPQIIDGKLHVLGNLRVDPKAPKDTVIGGQGYQP